MEDAYQNVRILNDNSMYILQNQLYLCDWSTVIETDNINQSINQSIILFSKNTIGTK